MAERRTIIKNKKGSISDIAQILVILITIGMVTLIVYKISDSINTEIQESSAISDLSGGNRSKDAINAMNNHFPGIIDNSMMFLLVGLCVIALSLAMMVSIHPIFFLFYFVMMGIIIWISAAFSNIYQKMAENAAYASLAANLTFTTFIITYLPFIVGVLGFVLSVVMYKTWATRQ